MPGKLVRCRNTSTLLFERVTNTINTPDMTKPWLASYPPGVPYDIDPDQFQSIVELCAKAWNTYPDHLAFGNFGTYLAFSELERLSGAFAAYLQQSVGIESGDRVAIMLPNLLQYPVAMLGALRCGATIVNTNPQYTARELVHQLKDSGAIAIVAFNNVLPTLHEVISETSLRTVIATELGDLFPFPKSLVFNRAARRGDKFKGAFQVRFVTFNDALKAGAKTTLSPPEIVATDLAFLQYTGGTTGISKAAMLSHRNIIANILQVAAWFNESAEDGHETMITALPLYHIYALTVNCLSFLHHGGMNYLITDPRDTTSFIKELRRVRFTGISGVNTLFLSLLQHDDIKQVDFSNLKYASGGGMAILKSVSDDWEAVSGHPISEGYGLTEASPVVCVNPFDTKSFTGSVGLPVPSTECRIVDDNDDAVPVGMPGELCVRGPQVMMGYWQSEEETATALDPQGWLRTGDIATMDEDGYFRIVDRKKDMILVSGFNVYPNEIEDVVSMHPGVNEVAAISVPDAKTTEAVKIVVSKRDDNLDVAALLAHCRQHLTNYKIPRDVEFAPELPKSNVGKILRRVVKERYGQT